MSPTHLFTYSLLMAYVAVSVLYLFLTHSHAHFLWRMWLLVFCVSSLLIHVLTSYGVCGCKCPCSFLIIHILTSYDVCGCWCSVCLPHSFTYSILMAHVAVSVLFLFLTHSHTNFLWRMWLLVLCVSSSLIHILTSYSVCGC